MAPAIPAIWSRMKVNWVERMSSDLVPVKRALLSVSDKSGLVDLGRALVEHGVELVSTGGTAMALRAGGLTVRDVSELTGFPAMMDGRVQTLHPGVHGGLLALRDNADHVAAMAQHGIAAIDLLVVNLYPFAETVASGAGETDCIENIDIGGPAMIRAAAKNHRYVSVLVDPSDYKELLGEMARNNGATSQWFRREMALRAFTRTAAYDGSVSTWMKERLGIPVSQTLRYGENPHQQARFIRNDDRRPSVGTAVQLQGKELSYNNINDTDAAFELVSEFDPADGPVVVIVKHANPCGVARGVTAVEAYRAALACDPTSAFGGIVALNVALDAKTAREITGIFTEVVIAPGADDAAKAVFASKKNLRLLTTDGLADPLRVWQQVKQVGGGVLIQDRDNGSIAASALKCVTKRQPSETEIADMLFAWKVAKHVKSNAIVYAKGLATVGIGAGQMSRVDSTRLAAQKAAVMTGNLGLAEMPTRGSVVASDAFFPFADGLLAAAEAGATAVIQPGGSLRDAEVIAAADAAGLAMLFTGMRHFRH